MKDKIHKFLDRHPNKEYGLVLSFNLDKGYVMFYEKSGGYFSINYRKIRCYFPLPKERLLDNIKEWGIKSGYRFVMTH